MEDVGPVHHESDVLGRRVHALAVLDRTLEHVGKLGLVAQKVGTHEVDHAPKEKKYVENCVPLL